MSFPPRTPSERKFLKYVVLWIYKTNASYSILGLNSFPSINVGYPEIQTTKLLYTVGAKYYSGASLIQTSNTYLAAWIIQPQSLCILFIAQVCWSKAYARSFEGWSNHAEKTEMWQLFEPTMKKKTKKKNGRGIIICWHWMIYISWISGHGLVPL